MDQQQNNKQPVKMFSVVKQDPNQKIYLVCLRTGNGDYWDILEGRQEAWDYIKEHIMQDDVDVEASFVLVDTVLLRKRVSVYDFIKYSEQFVNDPGFDIEDYVNGDVIQSTEEEVQLPESDAMKMNSMLMQGFMGDEFKTTDLK